MKPLRIECCDISAKQNDYGDASLVDKDEEEDENDQGAQGSCRCHDGITVCED